MRLGIVVPQDELGTDPGAILEWARTVDSLGFHHLDIFDHVLGADVSGRADWPGPYTHEHAFHEPFVLLAFLAGHVGLELSTGVLVLPQRQTALVAKQAAELDIVSGGRVRLGVGIGWNPVEYDALGVPFAERAARYEEQITLLRKLWTEPVVDHRGAHDRIDRAGIAPLPVQRPIPIWMGGGAVPAVLDRIGRLGDGWIAHRPRGRQEIAGAMRLVAAAAERAGRDARSIGVQGRIDVHGPIDRDRFVRAFDEWSATPATHLSVHATGQGGLAAHQELLHTVATLVADHLDRTTRAPAPPT